MHPELHPACAAFPALPESDLQELAEDIRKNGLLEPITLTPDGLLLDGRCRWDACEIAGVEPRTTVYAGADPIGFVLSKNKHRRHLTVPQKAIILGGLANLCAGSNQHQLLKQVALSESDLKLTPNGARQEPLGKLYGVNELAAQSGLARSTIQNGRVIACKAAPHIIAMVDNGTVSLRVAAEAVRNVPRTIQSTWTKTDVERAGKKVIKNYPSTVNRKSRSQAKPNQGPINIPYKPMVWPTKEELGYPADDAPLSEFDAFFKKHGRTPLHPKAVKELLDADGLSSSLAISVNSLTNDRHPDVERFFECIDHMLKHVPELGKTNGAQTDYAGKARKTLTMLERALPKALALLNALDAGLHARKADKGDRHPPALHLVG